MGVDYAGHHGLGYEIEPIDFDDENLDKETADLEVMCEFLDTKLDNDKYDWFETGEGSYTGEQNNYYICLREPFSNGFDGLGAKQIALVNHINAIGLKTKGEFGSIGGLEIW